jgi:hypothetical protein
MRKVGSVLFCVLPLVLLACSSDDDTSSSSSGGTTSSSSSSTSSGSTSSAKYSCSLNGDCFKCPTSDAVRTCFSDGPSEAGCTPESADFCASE